MVRMGGSCLRPTAAGAGLIAVICAATTGSYHLAEAAGPALAGVTIAALRVSPSYVTSGVIAATGTVSKGCSSNCTHLWVSHDRGNTWQQATATGWGGGSLVLASGPAGQVIMFSGSASGVQRSDDLGATWSTVGAQGNPSASPSFGSDQLVAVAGKSDYVLHGGSAQAVGGSGGTMTDGYWSLMPNFPSANAHPSVFLGGLNSAGKATVERCDTSFVCSAPVPLPVTDAFAGAPLLLPSNGYLKDGTVFAHTAEGLFKSVDGGTTYAPVTPVVPGATHVATAMTALSPSYQEAGPDRHLWEAVTALTGSGDQMKMTGDVYTSSDGGSTWKGVGPGGPFGKGAVAVAVTPDGRIFAGIGLQGGGGLLCSTDGQAWAGSCDTAAIGNGATTPPATTSRPGSAGCAGSACQPPSQVGAANATATAEATSSASAPLKDGAALSAVGNAGTPPSSGGGRMALVAVLAVSAAALAAATLVMRRRRSPSP